MNHSVLNRNTLLLLAATFFYTTSPMLIAPLLAGFSESLGLNAALAGMMTGIMYLSSLLCRPLFGRLADRKTKSLLMKSGLAVMACSVLLTAVSINGWMVLIARLLNGVGYCLCSISITTWIAALFPRDRIGTGMGLYGMMTALANAAGPVIALQVSSALSDRASFLISFVFLLIAFGLICPVSDKGVPAQEIKTIRQPLISGKALPFALIIMCFTIPFYATTAFLAEYTAARGWSASPSVYFLVYSLSLLVMRLLLKDSFDKLPFRIFFWSSLACGMLSCLLLQIGSSTLVYSIAGIGMAGGYGIMCSECQSAAILAVDPDQSGLASSTFYIGIDLGLLCGPTLAGEIISAFSFQALYPCMMAVLAICLIAYLPKRKTIGAIH